MLNRDIVVISSNEGRDGYFANFSEAVGRISSPSQFHLDQVIHPGKRSRVFEKCPHTSVDP
ncbi:hypothetical protein VI817_010042 [Penicillium citrinum]|nr:hypothetical protein VI817_010042 [Penicillium citrinum]